MTLEKLTIKAEKSNSGDFKDEIKASIAKPIRRLIAFERPGSGHFHPRTILSNKEVGFYGRTMAIAGPDLFSR